MLRWGAEWSMVNVPHMISQNIILDRQHIAVAIIQSGLLYDSYERGDKMYREHDSNGFSDDSNKEGKTAVLSDEDSRMYMIYGDIETRTCADIVFAINTINHVDDNKENHEKNYKREPIKLYINSFGGNVYAMWMLVDTILCSKTPVHTYSTGYAMSAAFQIFLAGHKRFVTEHTTLMYHQIYCWRSGKYQDLVEDREHMDHLNKQIEDYVIGRTKLKLEDISLIRERKQDTYFTAKEAVELGMADKILCR